MCGDRIVVGLCTHRRNEPLKEALDSLSRIALPEGAQVEFVLVDNDAAGGAGCVFDAYAPHMPFNCHYFIEKNRGLAHVRNRVLEEALALGATEIAMFDDDEIVDENWLVELHNVFRETGADGVCGISHTLLHRNTSKFIRKIWPPRAAIARTTFGQLYTGNCIFSAKLVSPSGMNMRFDMEFNASGSEDFAFSFHAHANGARIVHSLRPVVLQKFPPERCTLKYLLSREFRCGNGSARVHRKYGHCSVKMWLIAVLFVIHSALVLPFCALRGAGKFVARTAAMAKALGYLSGLFGKRVNFYLSDVKS